MLYLLKSDVKNAFQSHTLLFITLIIGITVSFYTVKMMLGIVQFQINAAQNRNTLHSFTVDFDGSFTTEHYAWISSILNSDYRIPNVLLFRTTVDEPMVVGFQGSNGNR